MTEKRFTIKDSTITDGYCIFDSEKEYHFVPNDNKNALMSTCKVLNELSEENEQLKSDAKYWAKTSEATRKENERLKRRIEKIDLILDDLNGAEYISRDDCIKALNKIDKVVLDD